MALKASKVAFEEFLKSGVWSDLRDIISERVELCIEELGHEEDGEDVWKDIRRVAKNRAKLGELQYLLHLPRFLLEQYDELSKIEEGEEDAG